jgi:hypothetical protein
MDSQPEKDIDALFADGTEIDKAITRAVREAVLRHKLLGNPVADWRDGKVVWLQPDEIILPEEEAGS